MPLQVGIKLLHSAGERPYYSHSSYSSPLQTVASETTFHHDFGRENSCIALFILPGCGSPQGSWATSQKLGLQKSNGGSAGLPLASRLKWPWSIYFLCVTSDASKDNYCYMLFLSRESIWVSFCVHDKFSWLRQLHEKSWFGITVPSQSPSQQGNYSGRNLRELVALFP